MVVDEVVALDANSVHIVDTGLRITGPGERLFKEEALRRNINYKPFLLTEVTDAIRAAYIEGTDVPKRIAAQISPMQEDQIIEATFIYPTSRTSWADCTIIQPVIENGLFTGATFEITGQYRIQRYSNGYTQYEINHDEDTSYILSGEHLAGDLLRSRPRMDSSGAESFDHIRLTEIVVR